ncbi:MAG: alpha/beta hydrolase [Microcoleaceae cyanobacterium]
MKRSIALSLCSALVLGTSAGFFWKQTPAHADSAIPSCIPPVPKMVPDKRIVLKYGALAQSICLSDLENFVKPKGYTSPVLHTILGATKIKPDQARGLMTLEVGMNLVPLSNFLYSKAGEDALTAIANTLQTRGNYDSKKALRAALVLAATDNKVSVLEILQNYPTWQMDVELANLGKTVEQLQGLASTLQNLK